MLNVCGWFYLFEKGRMNEQSAGRRGFDIRVYVHSNELQWVFDKRSKYCKHE